MLRTLFSASFTSRGAEEAKRANLPAVAAHQRAREPTEVGAVAIEANALGHHLDVGFTQARCCAVLACGSARVASFDAGSVLFM